MDQDYVLPFAAWLVGRRFLRPGQARRERQFAAVPRTPGRVVFLGDSITEGTAWEDWFPDLPTANRGIGGQAICDVIERLDTAIVEPRAISLLIGTNDLHGLGKSRKVPAIVEQMSELVDEIRELAPDAPLFINSVMPRSLHYRDWLIELNRGYAAIAAEAGATYIDLWPVLAGKDGAIIPSMTYDGLHLTAAGYKAWTDVLRPHLVQFAGASVEPRTPTTTS